jgi:hypothetical protein
MEYIISEIEKLLNKKEHEPLLPKNGGERNNKEMELNKVEG